MLSHPPEERERHRPAPAPAGSPDAVPVCEQLRPLDAAADLCGTSHRAHRVGVRPSSHR